MDNIGNSIRKLDMSIGSFAFDLRHSQEEEEAPQIQQQKAYRRAPQQEWEL